MIFPQKLITQGFLAIILSCLYPLALGQTTSKNTPESVATETPLEVALPKPFNQKKLVPFTPFAYSSLKFFVDPDSISIEKNDEVRLTVVTLNESGRYQGIYLGFDCENSNYQQYGFFEDEAWRRPKTTNWRQIPAIGYNQYVAYLAKWSTCRGNGRVISKYDLLDGLQGPKGPAF